MISPLGLQKDPDLEPSRYARDLPVWVARGSQKQIDDRWAALGRDNIAKPLLQPAHMRMRKRSRSKEVGAMKSLPLKEPAVSQLTLAMGETDLSERTLGGNNHHTVH